MRCADRWNWRKTNKKCELTMAAPLKSNNFAFIVNRHPFPNPCLVHVSRMSKKWTETLDCFKPNLIHAPRSMDFILKPLLHNEELFNFHRQVVKESMLEAITSNDKNVLESSTILQTLAVESVAKQETSRVLFGTGESTSRCFCSLNLGVWSIRRTWHSRKQ